MYLKYISVICRNELQGSSWACTVFGGVLRHIRQSEPGCQALSCLGRTSAGARQPPLPLPAAGEGGEQGPCCVRGNARKL